MHTAAEAAALRDRLEAAGASKAEIINRLAELGLGWPYVFGAIGELCTPANRDRRVNAAYPDIRNKCQVLNGTAGSCDGCEWDGPVRMFDCRGFTYWLLKQVGIEISTVGATTQWDDTDAWAMRGEIKNLPAFAVACVFKRKDDGKMSHTGMYLGGGQIIHCSGTVKRDTLPGTPAWTHFAIPKGLYTDAELAALAASGPARPTLRRGAVGDAVRQMQELLIAAGYDVGSKGADGKFGPATESALLAYQADHGLKADGICGPKTWAELDKAPDDGAEVYTVHIPDLDKATAEAFAATYAGAWITKGE